MSQSYGWIGQASEELERVAAEHQGWGKTAFGPSGHDVPVSQIEEMTDRSDYSFWDRRANRQALGQLGGSAAEFTPGPIPHQV